MFLTLLTGVLVAAAPLAAHEYWIEPERYHLSAGAPLLADLRNGQDFRGSRLPYIGQRIRSFRLHDSEGSREIEGVNGDRPAARLQAPAPGLVILSYHSQPDSLEFRSFESFAGYVRYEGLDWAIARHRADGLPDSGFSERYTRNAKALVQVGPHAQGADRLLGLPLELVVDGSPYAPGRDAVPVRLFRQGVPVADWPINVFTRADGGRAALSRLRTDGAGRATVAFPPGSDILLNAVWLERAEGEFAWESWWASLTFGSSGAGGG